MTLTWTSHPILDLDFPPLSEGQLRALAQLPDGEQRAFEYWKSRKDRIQAALDDPLHKGFDLPFWRDIWEYAERKDEIYIFGGNGSAKTEFLCKTAVKDMLRNRGAKVLCISTDETSSKQYQQSGIYRYLPESFRASNESGAPRRRHVVTKINYSQAGGFTEATVVLPTRSQAWFKTVAQWLKSKEENTSFEGPEYDAIPIDEGCPLDLLDTLTFRAGKRAGKIYYTMTPVHGFDAVCGKVLTGAKVLKSLPMNWDWFYRSPKSDVLSLEPAAGGPNPAITFPELDLNEVQVEGLPPGHMPYIMQPLDVSKIVFFIWTHWNPFLPRSQRNPAVPALFDKCEGKGKVRTRIRLFGYATRLVTCQFPAFDPNVHVYPSEYMPGDPEEGTDYMAVDPAIARSNFALWVRVDRRGRLFVVDEFPRYASEGEWADDEGKRGEAQFLYGDMAVRGYKQLWRQQERKMGWNCEREGGRRGDPRGFASESEGSEGKKQLFDIYAEEDEFTPDDPDCAPMYFEPAMVKQRVSLEIEQINGYFAYDRKRAVSAQNEPKLWINARCQNTIRALTNWRPKPGASGLLKDETDPNCEPIDALRYVLDRELFFQDPEIPTIVGGRGITNR